MQTLSKEGACNEYREIAVGSYSRAGIGLSKYSIVKWEFIAKGQGGGSLLRGKQEILAKPV